MSMSDFARGYEDEAAHESYEMIDRFLRHNLDDDAYREYSEALEIVYFYNNKG